MRVGKPAKSGGCSCGFAFHCLQCQQPVRCLLERLLVEPVDVAEPVDFEEIPGRAVFQQAGQQSGHGRAFHPARPVREADEHSQLGDGFPCVLPGFAETLQHSRHDFTETPFVQGPPAGLGPAAGVRHGPQPVEHGPGKKQGRPPGVRAQERLNTFSDRGVSGRFPPRTRGPGRGTVPVRDPLDHCTDALHGFSRGRFRSSAGACLFGPEGEERGRASGQSIHPGRILRSAASVQDTPERIRVENRLQALGHGADEEMPHFRSDVGRAAAVQQPGQLGPGRAGSVRDLPEIEKHAAFVRVQVHAPPAPVDVRAAADVFQSADRVPVDAVLLRTVR